MSTHTREWSTSDFGKIRRLEQEAGNVFEKAVLRVGRWTQGFRKDGTPDVWNVTPDTLDQIVRSFAIARANGADCPVQFNHENDPKNRCGSVVAVRREGEFLVARMSIPNAKNAAIIEQEDLGTSVETHEPGFDGTGQTYPIRLTHVAVVNHPVCTGLGRFRRLSLFQDQDSGPTPEKGKVAMKYAHAFKGGKWTVRRLAEGEAPASGEFASDSATSPDGSSEPMDRLALIKKFVGLAAKALQMPSAGLPDDTTEENLDDRLKLLLGVLEGLIEKQEQADSTVPPDLTAVTDETIQQMSLPTSRRQLSLAVGVLRRIDTEAKTRQASELQDRQMSFETKVHALAADLKILPDDVVKVRQLAQKVGFDSDLTAAILSPYEKAPAKGTTPQTSKVNQMSLGRLAVTPEGVSPDRMTTEQLLQASRAIY